MKKTICLIMTAILALAFTACSAQKDDPTSTQSETQAQVESKAQDNQSEITSFEDVATDKVSLIALGNSDVPVGQYSEEIFKNLGVWDDIQSKISFGSNVKQVLSQVSEKSVGCGVVYRTDAVTEDGVEVVCTPPQGALETPVIYPAAVLKNSKNAEAAKSFLIYLLSDAAKAEFEKVGFKMATDNKPGETKTDAKCTINVFAAASLTESLTQIQKLYNVENPDVEIVFNFDSSGTLKTQIESGADVDVFISAATKQMNGLKDGGYIDESTELQLLENEVVLIVPKK